RAVREILLAVGENPDREGLLETPARVARILEEARTQNSSRESYEETVAAYEKVVAKDPTLLAAHVGLTRLHGIMFWYGYLDPSPARRAKLEAAALDVTSGTFVVVSP
ncbi:MAG: hypothetical protein EBY93_07580, partial [Actinobacteria bacterium]|nr:hypothetical protein [Actinomycetota bacterium]